MVADNACSCGGGLFGGDIVREIQGQERTAILGRAEQAGLGLHAGERVARGLGSILLCNEIAERNSQKRKGIDNSIHGALQDLEGRCQCACCTTALYSRGKAEDARNFLVKTGER